MCVCDEWQRHHLSANAAVYPPAWSIGSCCWHHLAFATGAHITCCKAPIIRQDAQWPWLVQKWLRSVQWHLARLNPGCRIVGSSKLTDRHLTSPQFLDFLMLFFGMKIVALIYDAFIALELMVLIYRYIYLVCWLCRADIETAKRRRSQNVREHNWCILCICGDRRS